MTDQFDLIVIGSGSAGTTVALACRAAGWKVAIVDSRPFGGTCALRGCDPKKVLVGAAELVDWANRMRSKGVVGDLRIDWPSLMKFERTFTEPVPAQREKMYRDAGIMPMHGRARFSSRTTIDLDGATLNARHVVIAAGARPQALGIPGEDLMATSDDFLELDALPHDIIFIGGGYVSFEFANIAARAGAKATILHRGSQPLEGFDPELVAALTDSCRHVGIDIQLKAAATGIEHAGNARLRVRTEPGGERSFEGDLVVHGAGRVPDIADLNLDVAGVDTTKKGVKVDQHLQSTSNPAVYAAGDCADGGGLPLTPVAGSEGEIVADNLLHGNRSTVDFSVLPSIVYSIPALASVGLRETEARDRGLRFQLRHGSMDDWYSQRRLAAAPSGYKLLIEDPSGKILGAHILGQHAEEQINVIAVAMRAGLSAVALANVNFGYPTGASDIQYMI
jgi:glutathione reductase (NADPH)